MRRLRWILDSIGFQQSRTSISTSTWWYTPSSEERSGETTKFSVSRIRRSRGSKKRRTRPCRLSVSSILANLKWSEEQKKAALKEALSDLDKDVDEAEVVRVYVAAEEAQNLSLMVKRDNDIPSG